MRSGGMIVRLRYSPNSRPSDAHRRADLGGPRQQIDRALVEAEVVGRADDGAVLNHVDAVAGEPGHEQRRRVDLADVPQAGQQEPPFGAGHHVVDRAAAVPRHSAAPGCRCRARHPTPDLRRAGPVVAQVRQHAVAQPVDAPERQPVVEDGDVRTARARSPRTGVHVDAALDGIAVEREGQAR